MKQRTQLEDLFYNRGSVPCLLVLSNLQSCSLSTLMRKSEVSQKSLYATIPILKRLGLIREIRQAKHNMRIFIITKLGLQISRDLQRISNRLEKSFFSINYRTELVDAPGVSMWNSD